MTERQAEYFADSAERWSRIWYRRDRQARKFYTLYREVLAWWLGAAERNIRNHVFGNLSVIDALLARLNRRNRQARRFATAMLSVRREAIRRDEQLRRERDEAHTKIEALMFNAEIYDAQTRRQALQIIELKDLLEAEAER